jgi:uncharacterized small protein (DUF1192 family)
MEDSLIEGDAPRPKARLVTPPLDPLGVAELQNYINELRHEITRAEDAITRKLGHRNAADSVFRRP